MNIDGERIFVKGFHWHPYVLRNIYYILYFISIIHIIQHSNALDQCFEN